MGNATAVIVTLAACGLAAVIWRFVDGLGKRQEARARAERDLVRAVEVLTATSKEMTDAAKLFSDIPKILEGLTRIAKAQTVEIAKLRLSVDRFSKIVVKPEDRVKPVETPTDEEANAAFEIASLLRENPAMDPEVARQKVKDEWELAAVNSAIGME